MATEPDGTPMRTASDPTQKQNGWMITIDMIPILKFLRNVFKKISRKNANGKG